MSKLLEATDLSVQESSSILAIERINHGMLRYLTLNGERTYTIGNVCDTCGIMFERLGGGNQKVSPVEISERLREGITSFDQDLVETIGKVLPIGNYKIGLLKLSPKVVKLGSKDDYFANELYILQGPEQPWGLPHYPKVEYYRLPAPPPKNQEQFFEFIFPIMAPYWNDRETVAAYRKRLKDGEQPTALALSFYDIKQPWRGVGNPKVKTHRCLAHILLDGHHKIQAAAQTRRPITLLMFLAVDESVASKEDVNAAMKMLANSKRKYI